MDSTSHCPPREGRHIFVHAEYGGHRARDARGGRRSTRPGLLRLDTVEDGTRYFRKYCYAFIDDVGDTLEHGQPDGSVRPIVFVSRTTFDSERNWTRKRFGSRQHRMGDQAPSRLHLGYEVSHFLPVRPSVVVSRANRAQEHSSTHGILHPYEPLRVAGYASGQQRIDWLVFEGDQRGYQGLGTGCGIPGRCDRVRFRPVDPH